MLIDSLYEEISKTYFNRSLNLRIKQKRSTFFEYFFLERKKINSWNRKHGLIHTGLLGFKAEVNKKGVKSTLDHVFLKQVSPFCRIMPEIIKNGWNWSGLYRDEYNSLVYFKDFCDKFERVYKQSNLDQRLVFVLEESFLKLVYRSDHTAILERAFDKVLQVYTRLHRNEDIDQDRMIKRIETLLNPELLPTSLHDCFLAFNISYYRRFFQWSDLSTSSCSQILDNGFFFCSREVFEDIINFIARNKARIASMETDLVKAQWMKSVSDAQISVGPLQLMEFYTRIGHNWQNDSDDIILMMVLICGAFNREITIALRDDWKVMDQDEEHMKIKLGCTPELDQFLNRVNDDYDLADGRYSNMRPHKVSMADFMESSEPQRAFVNSDNKYIFEKLYTVLTCYYQMSQLLYDRYRLKDSEDEPSLRYMITESTIWTGEPVFAVFKYYSELAMQICRFFQGTQYNRNGFQDSCS
jgi:hypothetical protein